MPVKLICIVGPTASGKSDLALKLAKKYGGFLIAADSRQIYKEMDILTGKDKGKWEKQNSESAYMVSGVREYMVDLICPKDEFTLFDYQRSVFEIIDKNADKKNIPILVGGTGLYVSSVIDNYCLNEIQSDNNFRLELENTAKEKGTKYLYDELLKFDPKMKNHIEENNTRKIIRALEVCSKSGRPFSEQLKKGKPKYALLFMGVKTDRKELYERINKRVDEMLASGGWEEAKNIWQKYEANLPSASAIGYRQLFSYFEGKISKKEAMELLKRDTRRYAKRQLTWFNRDKRIKWIKSFKEADKLTRDFLK